VRETVSALPERDGKGCSGIRGSGPYDAPVRKSSAGGSYGLMLGCSGVNWIIPVSRSACGHRVVARRTRCLLQLLRLDRTSGMLS
jgi:hypothetical protein